MRILITFFFLLIFQLGFSQYFNGEITYEWEIIPKKPDVNVDSILDSKKGAKMVYLITDKYYKTTYYKNEKPNYSYTYHDETKRMYDEYSEREYITFRDSQKSNSKYGKMTVLKDSIKNVLGRNCYLVKSEADYGNSSTYYSNEVRINSESFKGHQVGNWYNKLKKVNGAISLYTKTEFKDHYEIQKAVDINKRKVSKSEFSIPKNKTIAASFSALDKQVEMLQPEPSTINCFKSKLLAAQKNKGSSKEKTIYIRFILSESGEIKNLEPYEKDPEGLYKLGIDILNNCDLKFSPGTIKGKKVSSEVFFPVTL